MDIAIFIHRHDVLAEHHLSHTPETVHHLERLIRILLSDAYEDQIVKYAFRRQRHVHNLWKIHFEHWQENPHARITDVIVFHRRFAHDRCGINCIASMGDGGHMENWIIFNRCIKAGVIAKGTFWTHLAGLHISFQNKVDVCRHIEINGFAADELD